MLSVDIKWSRCPYGIPISRIANAFLRRDRDVSHTETNSKAGCETEKAMAQTCSPSTGPAGRLSRKDKFEYHILREISPTVDLFEATEELCKCYIDREPANFSLFIRAASSSFIPELFRYLHVWWWFHVIHHFEIFKSYRDDGNVIIKERLCAMKRRTAMN